jgi:hypothetical protein
MARLAAAFLGVANCSGARAADAPSLGLGESGLTDFPHVHLTVRHDGATVDPFTALPASVACDAAEGGATLWSATARSTASRRRRAA